MQENKETRHTDDNEKELLKDMITLAIEDACDNIGLYRQLAGARLEPSDKELINAICLDKIKQKKYLEEVYIYAFCEKLVVKKTPAITAPAGALSVVFKKKMFEELANIDFLRKLQLLFEKQSTKDIMYELIIDEQTNAQWLFYLYDKYR